MDAPGPKGEASDGSAAAIARHDEPPSTAVRDAVEIATADAVAWLASHPGLGRIDPPAAPGGAAAEPEPEEVSAADAVAWLASRSGEGRIDAVDATALDLPPSATRPAEPSPPAARATEPPAPAEGPGHDVQGKDSLPHGAHTITGESPSTTVGEGGVGAAARPAAAAEPELEEVTAADALAWLERHSGEGRIEPDDDPPATIPAQAEAEGAALFCRIAERAGVLTRDQVQSLLDAWRQQPSQGADALARASLALGLLTPQQLESVLRLAGLTPTAPIDAGPSFLPDGPEFALLVRLKRLAADGDLTGCAALQTQLAGTVFARLGDVIVRKSALARGAPPPSPSPPSTPSPIASPAPRPARPTPTPVRAARRAAFDLYVRLKQAVARGDTGEAGALREQLRGDPEFDRLAEGLVRKVWGRQALVSARATGATLVPCPGCRTPAPADAPCPRCGAATPAVEPPQPPPAGGP